MDMKMNYTAPRITVVELNTGSVLCTSPALMGSASNEGYTEEYFEW